MGIFQAVLLTVSETAPPPEALPMAKNPLAEAAGSIVILLLFMAALLAGAWFLKRRAGGSGLPALFSKKQPAQRRMQVLERISIDRETGVFLLEWEGERYLVGASSGGMRLLDKKPVPEEEELPPARPMRNPFQAFLNGAAATQAAPESVETKIAIRRQRLERMKEEARSDETRGEEGSPA